jgi:hypothetical protein
MSFPDRVVLGAFALSIASCTTKDIVYISGDMGDPARHSSRGVPTLLAGGGGQLKMGRYLDFRGAGSSGIPNNRILVSICQAFGVAVDRFGHATDSAIVSGALSA